MAPTPTHVLVRNPVTGGEWACPAAYLGTAVTAGWELVTATNAADDEIPTATAYDGHTISGLKNEIGARNAQLPDDEQLSTAGNKPDLIATLIADDARRTPTGSDS